MIYAALAACFVFALVASVLLAFPELRPRLPSLPRPRWNPRRTPVRAPIPSSILMRTQPVPTLAAGRPRPFTRAQRRLFVIAAFGALVAPAIVALRMRPFQQLDAFDDDARDRNRLVTTLLEGEHLIPPPPLPPEVFTTREVELIRPALAFANRDWALMDDDFRKRLLLVFKLMLDQFGYPMALLEGYRSPERQNALSAMGGNVTNAGAYQSYHQYGLAADCAFLRDGKLVISERDPWAMTGYQHYGEIAESLGLRWGGRWKLMDYGHVELRRVGAGPGSR